MGKRCGKFLVLTLLHGVVALADPNLHGAASKATLDKYPSYRAAAAGILAGRGDAESMATAAALTFVGPPTRSKAEAAKAATAALQTIVKASDLAPADVAISWLRLQICATAPACNIRDAATTMRWVDADNAAAWLSPLAAAQRDKDSVEIDRVLNDMAQGAKFALYQNRIVVLIYDSLQSVRRELPSRYLPSDLDRLTEAMGVAAAAAIPSFSPLVNTCRDAQAVERREPCIKLAKTMQHADTLLAQSVGFAVEKRFTGSDSKEFRAISERRRLLEWRAWRANQSDTPLLPWLRNARARARLAKMRTMPREEDVYIAILREHKIPLDLPEEHR